MFTAEEATKERVDAYLAGLERELDGYQFRVKALADGKFERLTKEQLEARVKAVQAEIARVKKVKPAEPDGDEPEDDEA